jgi:hypothetical protein
VAEAGLRSRGHPAVRSSTRRVSTSASLGLFVVLFAVRAAELSPGLDLTPAPAMSTLHALSSCGDSLAWAPSPATHRLSWFKPGARRSGRAHGPVPRRPASAGSSRHLTGRGSVTPARVPPEAGSLTTRGWQPPRVPVGPPCRSAPSCPRRAPRFEGAPSCGPGGALAMPFRSGSAAAPPASSAGRRRPSGPPPGDGGGPPTARPRGGARFPST